MPYKVEAIYWDGWADAGWTELSGMSEIPLRFNTYEAAEAALVEYFTEVRAAVRSGNLDEQRCRSEFRIVVAKD